MCIRFCAATNDVIVDQSEWLQDESTDGLYLRQTLTYVRVPSDIGWMMHQFSLNTEDGLSYTRTLTLPVLHPNNKTVFSPAKGISLRDYVTTGNSVISTLANGIQYTAMSLQSLAVQVFKYTLHEQRPLINNDGVGGKSKMDSIVITGPGQIYDISTLYDDNMASVRSPQVGVFHAGHCHNTSNVDPLPLNATVETPMANHTPLNISGLCSNHTANCTTSWLNYSTSDVVNLTTALPLTLTCHVYDYDTTVRIISTIPVNSTPRVETKAEHQQQQRFVVRFETADEQLDVCSDGGGSLLPDRALRVEVTSCDSGSQRRPGRFEFTAEVENCILCTAAGNPRPEVTLYHDGFPVGSWSGHSVYTYSPQRDTAAVLLVLTQPFSGTFYCAARLHADDEGSAVEFHIDVPDNK